MGIHGHQTHEPWDQYQELLLRLMIIGESWEYFTRGLWTFPFSFSFNMNLFLLLSDFLL